MNISVIGTGYVGIISAVGWAGFGHDVVCIDTDADKIAKVNAGIPPIFEEGLEERLKRVLKVEKLTASTGYSSIQNADIVLISVGTPSAPDGSMDMKYVRSAAESIAKEMSFERFQIIVVRSTVVPGTTEKIVGETIERLTKKKAGTDYGLSMIPEFLKEGTAIEDFDKPDRVVAGVSDEKTRKILDELHTPFSCPKLFVGIKTAEMIKYASNSMLATKISFANEFASMCERLGIDVDEVMKGAGMDSRIGPHFLVAGAGFGGSCFPKDVKAIVHKSAAIGVEPKLLRSVLEVNARQQLKLVEMLKSRMPKLDGKSVAVLGLAFKAGTDDVRESSAIAIISELRKAGASVRAYDPKGEGNMKKIYPDITYSKDWADCLKGADAALLVTAWPQFKKSAGEYKSALNEAPLFDARRILVASDAKEAGLEYICIGRGNA